MTRQLAELSAPDAYDQIGEGAVLLQPLGAIEQHGPHLPLATDLIVATEVAQRVVAERGDELDLWVLPPLAYTKSDEHAWAAGTVWLSATTMLAVLSDVGRSVSRLRARRLVLFNGHGGNTALCAVAARQIRLDYGLLTFVMHPYLAADQGGPSPEGELGMGVHGGLDETSTILYLRPDLVDMSRAERAVPEVLAQFEKVRFGGAVPFGWSSDDFGPSGVIGDPTGSTAERGRDHVEAAVKFVGEALAEVARFDLPLKG
jgi:creatinine amidohydrolase